MVRPMPVVFAAQGAPILLDDTVVVVGGWPGATKAAATVAEVWTTPACN